MAELRRGWRYRERLGEACRNSSGQRISLEGFELESRCRVWEPAFSCCRLWYEGLRIRACSETQRPREMTLEVEGAPAAPSKSLVPGHQTTAASWLKCFWVDALDFLHMWGQQSLLSRPPDPRSFQMLSYACDEPQTGKGWKAECDEGTCPNGEG